MKTNLVGANNQGAVQSSKINSTANAAMNPKVSFKGEDDSFKKEQVAKQPKTEPEKQEILKKAQQKAAGYAFWGGIWSTMYYGLRSDAKIARKYDLDPVADKKFISQIKDQQTKYTIPGIFTPIGGAIAYFYAKGKDSEILEVK